MGDTGTSEALNGKGRAKVEISEDKIGDVLVLAVGGRLDSASAPDFETSLRAAADAGSRAIVADFAGLEYVSSAGLRALLSGAKHLQQAGGKIALCGMQEHVREVFEVSGFLNLFPASDDREQAARSLD